MGKVIKFTCDYPSDPDASAVCGSAAEYRIIDQIQNGNTVYSVAERYSCDDPIHLGQLVKGRPSMDDMKMEAIANENSKRASIGEFHYRAATVQPLNEVTD